MVKLIDTIDFKFVSEFDSELYVISPKVSLLYIFEFNLSDKNIPIYIIAKNITRIKIKLCWVFIMVNMVKYINMCYIK